jgi:hypothetical protein
MSALPIRLAMVTVSAAAALAGTVLAAAPAAAADGTGTDYWTGVYGRDPGCPVDGYCGGMIYFDCDGIYGPAAACDDPAFWEFWSMQ